MADTIYTSHPASISGVVREFKLYDEQTTTAGGTVYFNEFPTTAGFAYIVEGWIIAYKSDFSEKATYQVGFSFHNNGGVLTLFDIGTYSTQEDDGTWATGYAVNGTNVRGEFVAGAGDIVNVRSFVTVTAMPVT